MKTGLTLAAAMVAGLSLAGCSSSGDDNVEALTERAAAWQVAPADAVAVDCADLLEAWGDGTESPPAACFTMEVADDLPERFAETTASFAEHMGPMDTVLAPACTTPRENGVTLACAARYDVDGTSVGVSSGVTISALTEDTLTGAAQSAINEITIFVIPPDQQPETYDDFLEIYSVPVG
ncbi:hypothetical protein [Demequina aurantiaca]|uniref:hypothetical protein n=1 Tax=Demequina aurantiaca TaxID=676200 RepID=UPI003D345AEB